MAATLEGRGVVLAKHLLPPLPYAPAALEPHVDARTLTLHHDMHHASYVANLNAALEKHPELFERTAEWLVLNPGKIPEDVRVAVANNAGGHVNHSLLWKSMSPAGGGEPSGALADAIKDEFGSVNNLKTRFNEAGEKIFGSGWVWLARSQRNGKLLEVMTTNGHASPALQGHVPILVNDVWEHAYYLKHETRRAEYLKGWWSIVNWPEAARRFAESGK